jgi:hypothetical protein
MRRRSEDMKKKCTRKNEKNMRENKSVRIGDVFLQTLLERRFKAPHAKQLF